MKLPRTVQVERVGRETEYVFRDPDDLKNWADEMPQSQGFQTAITGGLKFFKHDWSVNSGRLEQLGGSLRAVFVRVVTWWDRGRFCFAVNRMVEAVDGYCYSYDDIFGTCWLPTPDEIRLRAAECESLRPSDPSDWCGYVGPGIQEIAAPCLR